MNKKERIMMNYSNPEEMVSHTTNKNQQSMNSIGRSSINRVTKKILALAMLAVSMLMTTVEGYSQCANSALVCNNLVRVSLDTSCTALITPDQILKGNNIDNSLYFVEVRNPAGDTIPNDLLTQDYDGQRLEVRVFCAANNLFCWGSIIVEDKIPPEIEVTPEDTILSCIVMPFDLDPNALVNR